MPHTLWRLHSRLGPSFPPLLCRRKRLRLRAVARVRQGLLSPRARPRSVAQDAIRAKQREQEGHRAALDAIMAQGMDSGVHPLERPEVPAHIKVRSA